MTGVAEGTEHLPQLVDFARRDAHLVVPPPRREEPRPGTVALRERASSQDADCNNGEDDDGHDLLGQVANVDAATGAKSVVLVAARAGGEVGGILAHALTNVCVPEPTPVEARRPLGVVGAHAPTLRRHERLPPLNSAIGGAHGTTATARGVLHHLGSGAG